MSKNEEGAVLRIPEQPRTITKWDLFKTWIRWVFFSEVAHSYERLQSLAFCNALTPILKKLYPKGGEEFNEALARHLEFFNTEPYWGGGTILGITAALEEERAKGIADRKEDVLDPGIISSTKVGLMGPFAGIGDSIDEATLMYLLIAIAIPWAKSGLWIAGVFPFVVFAAATYSYGFYFLRTGYRLGREAATEVLRSGMINKIILGASVLGLFMMGVLAASYVSVSSSLKWTLSGKEFSLQGILNSILPGLLPFATVMLIYLYLVKKGLRMNRVLLYVAAIFFVLGLIGIL